MTVNSFDDLACVAKPHPSLVMCDADVKMVLRALPGQVLEFLQVNADYCVAGGFVRDILSGQKPQDIDLFRLNDGTFGCSMDGDVEALSKKMGYLAKECESSWELGPQWGLVGPRVQFIHRFTYPNYMALLDSFDFTIVQACIFGSETGYHMPRFYQDLAARRLRFTNPPDAASMGGSLVRACNFIGRGYTMSRESLAEIVRMTVRRAEQRSESLEEFFGNDYE
jgi:hypothetical protein